MGGAFCFSSLVMEAEEKSFSKWKKAVLLLSRGKMMVYAVCSLFS